MVEHQFAGMTAQSYLGFNTDSEVRVFVLLLLQNGNCRCVGTRKLHTARRSTNLKFCTFAKIFDCRRQITNFWVVHNEKKNSQLTNRIRSDTPIFRAFYA